MSKHVWAGKADAEGDREHALLCDTHLAEWLRKAPLGEEEYVLDADDDLDCLCCPSHPS